MCSCYVRRGRVHAFAYASARAGPDAGGSPLNPPLGSSHVTFLRSTKKKRMPPGLAQESPLKTASIQQRPSFVKENRSEKLVMLPIVWDQPG